MSDLTNQSPYYDNYDSSKQYTQIVAVPGRIEQAREFTQVQTMIFDFLKRLSDTLLKDGNIVSGMGFKFDGNNITVDDGKVYIAGKIHSFSAQTLSMTKTGYEIIGVKLQETMITENEDSSLRDPALNMSNYGQPGAYRVKSVPVLTLNDNDSSTLYEFQDGDLKVEVSRPAMDGLTDILARRTYDESGNYKVRGLELHVAPHDATNVQLTVEVGTCYVKGYEIIKPTPVKVLLPISKDVKAQLSEPKTYISGTSTYALNNYPAKDITRVVAVVQKTTNMTRGSQINGIDYLPDSSIISISSVTAGATTYINGTDFQLTSDGVDWNFAGAEPTVGSTYSVTYKYNKNMVAGTDYQLYQITGQWGETKDYVQFLAGDVPVANSTFDVDYEYFLARKDLVSIDKKGEIVVTSGQPNIDRLVKVPFLDDSDLLNLGSVYLPPNSGNAKSANNAVTRLDMTSLQRMMERLETVEYNQAITALDQEAMSGESPADLIGVFSDGFKTTQKGDLTHPDFSVMYSLEDGMIMIPPKNTNFNNPTINETNSDAKIWGRIVSAPMTELLKISQPYATTTMKINPYLAFNTLGLLTVEPAIDNWIDTAYIKIEDTQFEARNFYRWWTASHSSDKWRYDVNKDIMSLPIEGGAPSGTTLEDWRPTWQGANIYPQATVTKTEKSTSILEEAITYMRQRQVTITAANLSLSSDNLACTFDGVSVSLTPAIGYQAGTNSGTVRSNSSGKVVATFTIPPNIKTGTREIILSNADNVCSCAYTSIGTKETTVEKILTTRITLTAVDPVAQTFQFDEDTILTSFGAYFAAKDNVNNVSVQIRNVVNGYPGNVIYGEKVLYPSDIKVSGDATLETKVTFDDPIMCNANTQFCVIYATDSSEHALYMANLGDTDITTGQVITRQPYLAGVLFSSSNGIAWTAHQSMRMKFNIYIAQFQETGTVEFDPIFNISADKILLMSDYLTPSNTGCIWEMSLDDGVYQPAVNYIDIDFNKVINKVTLRATFKSDSNMSPLMAKDSFTLIGFLQDTSGSYISLNTDMIDPYIHVKQVYEAYVPQGSTVTPQFSYDDGVTWITPPQVSSNTVALGWTRYTHEVDVSLAENAMKFRARMNITATSSVLRPKVRKFMCTMK